MLKTENTIVDIKYQQTGTATAVNPLGMREMPAMAYEHRSKRFLLIKAPPASGKSRALMFIALYFDITRTVLESCNVFIHRFIRKKKVE